MKNNEFLSNLSTADAKKLRDRIRETKINVLLVGGTGVGKSSTINALFDSQGMENRAKVGDSTKPETMEIDSYEMENLIIWDTPGLGDSIEKDATHKRKISEILKRKDANGQPLIDLVFLILDSSSRDFSSAFTLIEKVILPNLVEGDRDRLLIGLNRADNAMSGHFWNKSENRPEQKLIERLEEQVKTVSERIKADTGLDIEPIYYSAGCEIDGEILSRPYNLQKLLSFIMDRLPKKKRAAIAMHINENEANFRSNDEKADYAEKIEKSIFDSVTDWVKDVIGDVAGQVGSMIKTAVTDPNNIKIAAGLAFSAITAFLKKK